MTYVRMTTFQADPSKLEEGIRFGREQALATLRQQPGFEGTRVLVDRTSGKTISVTLWASEAAARGREHPQPDPHPGCPTGRRGHAHQRNIRDGGQRERLAPPTRRGSEP